MLCCRSKVVLLLVSDGLRPQEFFDAPVAVEATKTTRLGSSVRQRPFVVNSHRVDVYSTGVWLAWK